MNRDGSAAALDAPSLDPLKGTKYDFPRDSVGYGRKSLNPQWPKGAKIAVSFVINYEEVSNPQRRQIISNAVRRDRRDRFKMGMLSRKTDSGSSRTSRHRKENAH
jgi:hypothetical protein